MKEDLLWGCSRMLVMHRPRPTDGIRKVRTSEEFLMVEKHSAVGVGVERERETERRTQRTYVCLDVVAISRCTIRVGLAQEEE